MTFPIRSFVVLAAGLSSVLIPAQARAADSYQADPVHSSVVFRVKHLNTSYTWGRFNEILGTFSLDPADPSKGSLTFQVKADSVDTGNAKRDQHLKGPDFFNVVQYPTIAFTSKSLTKAGDGYEAKGDLTLHGATKPITVRLTPTGTGKTMTGAAIAGIEATFVVKQSDFGITKMAAAIGDDVWVNVSVEGVKKGKP